MGFVKDAAKGMFGLSAPTGALGLAGTLLGKKKKTATGEIQMRPTMISTTPQQRPISMIGSSRGGY